MDVSTDETVGVSEGAVEGDGLGVGVAHALRAA